MSGARLARLHALAGTLAPPSALVDLDAFDANAGAMAARAGTLPVRVATKSIRSRDLITRALASSKSFAGLLAYSATEACFLADRGFDDVLVGYPTVDEAELEQVARRVRDGKQIVLTVDSAEGVLRHARVGAKLGVALPLAIDLDCATRFPGLVFGVRRSPVSTPTDAVALAATIEREDGVRLDGVLAYEAQIAGVRDRLAGDPLKSLVYRTLKRRSFDEVRQRRGAIVDALRKRFALRFVNGGGTGSLDVSRRDESLTELAAGSGFFAPTLFDGYDRLPLEPAAFFALSVSRVHDACTVVTSGGGYVASGPAGADRLPTPVFPMGGALLEHEGAGEVQTPVRFPSATRPKLGGRVLFRHAKAGELAERFERFALVRGDAVHASATTYRGDGKSFF